MTRLKTIPTTKKILNGVTTITKSRLIDSVQKTKIKIEEEPIVKQKEKKIKTTNLVKKTDQKKIINVVTDHTHTTLKKRPPGRPKTKTDKNGKKIVDIEPRAKGVMYFTKDTEEGIIAYNIAESQPEKDKIYNEKIRYAFEKIAENVYNTFKFSYADVSPLEIQKQAISHMVSNIDKYDQCKGKAFGYFSIVAKHWFILDNNNTYRRFKRHVEICEHPGDSGEFVVEPEHTRRDNEAREFIKLMVEFWDNNVEKYFTKPRDKDIAYAIVTIFRNADKIDVFNKKALYLYIRDIADCQTQHITKVINRMKIMQNVIANEYQDRGTVTDDGI
jgi:hypothetical protein